MKRRRSAALCALLLLAAVLLTACKGVSLFTKVQDWDTLTEDYFISSLSSDALTRHYYVQHPEDFGIDESTDSLGSLESINGEDAYGWAEEAIREVNACPDDQLNAQQKLDKQTFLWYLETEKMVDDPKFAYYEELAAPLYGLQSNLPITLANYAFNEEKDVDHYLALLDDVPRYMDELFAYEKERAERGYGMTDTLIDQVVKECDDFLVDPVEKNVLAETFGERLSALGITDAALVQTNLEKVRDKIYPAFRTFADNMQTLKGKSKGSGSLAELKYGKEYYAYLARQASSSDRSVEDLKTLLNQYYNQQYMEIMAILARDPSLIDRMAEADYGASEPEEILQLLEGRMGKLVPDIGKLSYTVRYVPESLEESSNPAFCFIPQIDNIQSSIYINQNPKYENMDFFITVAHEGLPGHMYQNSYYYGKKPAHFRHILDFAGYTEGWAVYISYQALGLSDIENEDLSRLIILNEAIGYEMSALADIGVNYEGWSQEQLSRFFAGWGLDEAAIAELYDQLISSPATYLSYSAACCEFWELQKYAQQKMGSSYTDPAFHQIILDAGPTSFSILKSCIDSRS